MLPAHEGVKVPRAHPEAGQTDSILPGLLRAAGLEPGWGLRHGGRLDPGMVFSQVGDAKTWEDEVLHRDSTKTVHFAHVCFRGHLFSEQDATPRLRDGLEPGWRCKDMGRQCVASGFNKDCALCTCMLSRAFVFRAGCNTLISETLISYGCVQHSHDYE